MFQLSPLGTRSGTGYRTGSRTAGGQTRTRSQTKSGPKRIYDQNKKTKELHENLHSMSKVSEKICYGERNRDPSQEPDREQDQEPSPVKI